jgi:hypothetical protein
VWRPLSGAVEGRWERSGRSRGGGQAAARDRTSDRKAKERLGHGEERAYKTLWKVKSVMSGRWLSCLLPKYVIAYLSCGRLLRG